MLKVYVLIYGLIALLPNPDSVTGKITSLTALVLATPPGTEYSWKGTFATHKPFRLGNFGTGTTDLLQLNGQQIEIGTPPSPSGSITLPNNLRTVDLKKVFATGQMPKLRTNCLVVSTCKDSSMRDLLAATITFKGGWQIKDVELNSNQKVVSTVTDKSVYGLMMVGPPPGMLLPNKKMELGGALLLEAEVANVNDLSYKEGAAPFAPLVVPCPIGTGTCIFIRVANLSTESTDCTNVTEFDRVDHHFDRIFELLDNPPMRFLPYVITRDDDALSDLCQGGPGGDPPAIKCPIPIVWAQ